MRILLDTNILLDVLLDRPGLADESEATIMRCRDLGVGMWVAWHGLATAYYLLRRGRTGSEAMRHVDRILAWARVATVSDAEARVPAVLDSPTLRTRCRQFPRRPAGPIGCSRATSSISGTARFRPSARRSFWRVSQRIRYSLSQMEFRLASLYMKTPKHAYVLRQSPSGASQLEAISLPKNVIVNGWAHARGLIGESDYWRFREIIRKTCYAQDKNLRRAGYGASTMWRFLNEMSIGDWVIVPHWGGVFYVAEITGDAYFDNSAQATKTDSCYRRQVEWLNDKQPIARRFARSKLISRMKTQQTSADANDLVDEVARALQVAAGQGKKNPDGLFANELRQKMVESVRSVVAESYMDERKFESLIQKVLFAVGADDAKIVPRLHDKGIDIIAHFPIGPVTRTKVGVQVKYHKGITGNQWIDQLKHGLEEEDINQGWLVTSADFAANAQEHIDEHFSGSGFQFVLIDGEQLAGIIVDCGLQNLLPEGSSS